MSTPEINKRDPEVSQVPGPELNSQTHSDLENTHIPEKLGPSTDNKNMSTNLDTVAKLGARFLAGAAGGALFMGVGLGSVTLSAILVLPALIVGIPAALLGTALGAGIGAKSDIPKIGAALGAISGAAVPIAAYLLAESIATIPKAAVLYTVGNLGCGLLAFAITGKTEKEQLANKKEGSLSSNQKLFNGLSKTVLPIFTYLTEFNKIPERFPLIEAKRNTQERTSLSQDRETSNSEEVKAPFGLGHLGENSNKMFDKYDSKVNDFIKNQLKNKEQNPYKQLADSYIENKNEKNEAYTGLDVINYIRVTVKNNKAENKEIYNQILDNILKSSGKKLEFTAVNFNAAEKFDENPEKVTAFIGKRLLEDPKDGEINAFRKIADAYISKNKIPNENKEAYSNLDVIDYVKNKVLNEKDNYYKAHHEILNHILDGTVIGGVYKFVENKRWGVEPGFEAKKIWTENNTKKINNPDHKYYGIANDFIKGKLEKEKLEKYTVKFNEIKSKEGSFTDEEIINQLKNDPEILKDLQEYFFTSVLKLHFVKLDYANPVSGLVSIDPGRGITTAGRLDRVGYHSFAAIVEKIKFINNIARDMHVSAVAETPREKNIGAIKEALANDIFEVLGFGGQKLKLVHAEYDDGASKLLLDGTMVVGPNGEKFSTLKGQIKNGRLTNNGIIEDGKFYPIDSKELAKAKIMTLLMGDRDKIGSEGGNVGYIVVNGEAKLMNIDPGKSLEGVPDKGKTDVMTQKNLHSDLSFDQPPENFKYKNLGVFDDTLLSEKIEGMRIILKSKPEIEMIFKAYENAFDRPGEDLDFKKDIAIMKKRLFDRIDYFEGVLKERVDLMNFDIELGPKALDCLDNIEKAFSETIDHVGEGNNKIAFQHLQVKPETRKEFHLVKDKEGDGFTLSFQGKSVKEASAMQTSFINYLPEESNKPEESSKQKFKGAIQGNEFKVKIANQNELNDFIVLFEEEKVAKYKKQSLSQPLEIK